MPLDSTILIPVFLSLVFIGVLGAVVFYWARDRRDLADMRIEKTRVEEQSKAVQAASENVQRTFEALAAEALKSNSSAFLDLARRELDQATKDASRNFERETEGVKKLVEPLQKTLDKYEEQIRDLELRRQRAFTEIEQHLKHVVEQSGEVAKQAAGLRSALTRSHVRGRWGEIQLKNCVELAGMSEYCDLHFQDSTRTEDGLVRPDMTVQMPAGRKIVVDAKVPLASFEAYIDAGSDEAARAAAIVQHGQQTRRHVDELSRKEYWDKVADSPDFVVMFLPNESFLYAALETQRDLMEYAMQKKVLIASPPSLVGLLKVIRYGWVEQRLADDAQKIAAEGRALHSRIVDFMSNFAELGKALSKVNKCYLTAEYNMKSRVAITAKRLEDLGAKGPKSIPELGVAALPAEFVVTNGETSVDGMNLESDALPEPILTVSEIVDGPRE